VILLWGLPHDSLLTALAEELRDLSADAVVLDQRRAARSTIDPSPGGTIETGERTIPLAQVTAVYPRPYDTTRLLERAGVAAGTPEWRRAHAFDQGMLAWLETTAARVVNRPSAMAANGSKPLQLAQLRAAGFRTPETLVTTDPVAVAEFRERHGEVVYKSVSGVRSRVARLGDDAVDRLGDVVWCPTQFQRYVPGREHRVHVVGDEVHAVEVRSDADDYRYPACSEQAPEIRPAVIPAGLAERARRFAAANELHLAGMDLRHGTDGEWYCLEANPSPAFTYFEEASGQPLTAAVARLLAAR
jgi:glutathione synthase/RimK-type ligase-like ATP-grasp enzyme